MVGLVDAITCPGFHMLTAPQAPNRTFLGDITNSEGRAGTSGIQRKLHHYFTPAKGLTVWLSVLLAGQIVNAWG